MTEENKDESNEVPKEEKPSFASTLFNSLPTTVFPLLASVAAALTLSTFFFEDSPLLSSRSKLSESEKMYAYLEKGVEGEKFTEDFFNTAFNHFDRKSDGSLSKYGRLETIEDFVVYLNGNGNKFKNEQIAAVNDFLRKTKEIEPFSALPVEERRLMDQLQFLVTEKENLQPVIQTLNELKQVILARHKEYQKIEAQNSWSLPLSFVGAFLTLVFGIWTTILSFRQSKNRYNRYRREIVEHSKNGEIRRVYYHE
ncbi:MAG: hypothetical protein ACYDAI_03615 [Trichloromonadaceae bacterium]